jgi:hypothetical protein
MKAWVKSRLRDPLFLIVFSSLTLAFFARLSIITHAMTHVDDIGPYAEIFIPKPSFWRVMLDVTSYTQAPGQFILQYFAFHRAHDYDSILFWIRLPSHLIWLTGLFCYFFVFRKFFESKSTGLVLFLMALALSSWRGIVDSWQSYNYATLSVFVPLLFYFFSRVYSLNKDAYPSPERWKQLGLGFILGTTLWVNYSALLLVASGFGCLIFFILLYAESARKKILLKNLAFVGAGFLVSYVIIYKYSLRGVVFNGIPGWRGGMAPQGFIPKIQFWFEGWFYIIKNNTAFLPWNQGADLTGIFFYGLIVLGLFRLSFKNLDYGTKRFYVMLGGFILAWTYLAFFRFFPMSDTRHTYIFQFPVLMLIGFSLVRFKIPNGVYYAFSALVVSLSLYHFPQLYRNVENKIDPKYLIQLADENPDAVMMGIYNTVTWDPVLLTVERPDLKGRLLLSETYWKETLANPKINHLILVSHRRGLDDDNLKDLRSHGYTVFENVKSIDPVGAIELSGTLNGGNGFYVYHTKKVP